MSLIRIHSVTFILNLLENIFFRSKFLKSLNELSINSTINHKDFLVVDIGANRAQNTLLISKKFKINKVVLVEPNKILHKFINQELKDFNHEILSECVTNYDGFVEFFVSNFDLTSSIIQHNPNSKYNRIKIAILGKKYILLPEKRKCLTLDSIVNKLQIDFIDYLKIDVEGAEFYVLQGAKKLIKDSRIGIIQLEIHKTDLRNNFTNEILELLQLRNYSLYKTVRHSFGNFSELIFVSENNSQLLRKFEINRIPKNKIVS
jgi:FkbM family methyltransferase